MESHINWMVAKAWDEAILVPKSSEMSNIMQFIFDYIAILITQLKWFGNYFCVATVTASHVFW